MANETSGITNPWASASGLQKISLLVGIALIVGVAAVLVIWAMDKDYRILFSDLQEEDAAAIVEELQNSKTPYELGNDGTSILVPEAMLHETRISLMAGGAPINGGVGFEIFDNQGLGATEQSQRVSYQRALQGELARTIGALDNVRRARVHLVLPESTLFKRDYQEPQAAVTLSIASGAVMERAQIVGIQRLVASSIANLAPAKVVITDQSGTTLSGAADFSIGSGTTDGRLSVKQETEEYVLRKIVGLLDKTYGPGKAIVSVDVTLNFDEVTRTVQGIGAPPDNISLQDANELLGSSTSGQGDGSLSSSPGLLSQIEAVVGNDRSESTYVGSVERIIAAPGGIERISVGVVVPGYIDNEQQSQIRQLVSVVAGLVESRGDAIVVQTLDQVGSDYVRNSDAAVDITNIDLLPVALAKPAPEVNSPSTDSIPGLDARVFIAAAGVLMLFVLLFFTRKRSAASLSSKERAALLAEIKEALGDGESHDYEAAIP